MDLSFLSSDIYQMPCQEFFYDCAAIPIPAVDSVCRFGMLRWTMENQYIITTILAEDISVSMTQNSLPLFGGKIFTEFNVCECQLRKCCDLWEIHCLWDDRFRHLAAQRISAYPGIFSQLLMYGTGNTANKTKLRLIYISIDYPKKPNNLHRYSYPVIY